MRGRWILSEQQHEYRRADRRHGDGVQAIAQPTVSAEDM